ncbi:MAG: LacI family DNA-binding transcriptional regulator [Fibrobacterota bacterium]
MKITLNHIAERAGVTKATASKALRNSPELNKDTVARVSRIALEMGYKPSPYKRRWDSKEGLGPAILKTVSLVFYSQTPAFIHSNPFFSTVASALHAAFKERGGLVLDSYPGTPDEFRRILAASNTDAAIVLGNIQKIEAETAYRMVEIAHEKPFLLLANYIPSLPGKFASVRADNVSAGYLMTKHLLKLGAKSVHFIESVPGMAVALDRQFGYRRAMAEAGLEPSVLRFPVQDSASPEQTRELDAVLRGAEAVGLLGDGDHIALRVGAYGQEKGLLDQERILIGGIDGLPALGPKDPRIATYKINIEELVNRALDMLSQMLQSQNCNAEQWLISGEIIRE